MSNLDNKTGYGLLSVLSGILPRGWRVEPDGTLSGGVQRYSVSSPGETGGILSCEVGQGVEPRQVPSLVERLRDVADGEGIPTVPFVVAPFLSGRTRELLEAEDVGYMDSTGNLRLVLDSPAVFLERSGAERRPKDVPCNDRKVARSLRGRKSARIVRAISDGRVPVPVSVKDISDSSLVDAGHVSRVLGLLEREGVVRRGRRGAVEYADVSSLVKLWAEDYSVVGSNESFAFYDPDTEVIGPEPLLERVAEAGRRGHGAVVTGSFAARRVAPYSAPVSCWLYTRSPYALAAELGLEPADDRPNVLLLVPFDDVLTSGCEEEGGVTYAADAQVAADLIGGSGREPASGLELLRVMERRG